MMDCDFTFTLLNEYLSRRRKAMGCTREPEAPQLELSSNTQRDGFTQVTLESESDSDASEVLSRAGSALAPRHETVRDDNRGETSKQEYECSHCEFDRSVALTTMQERLFLSLEDRDSIGARQVQKRERQLLIDEETDSSCWNKQYCAIKSERSCMQSNSIESLNYRSAEQKRCSTELISFRIEDRLADEARRRLRYEKISMANSFKESLIFRDMMTQQRNVACMKLEDAQSKMLSFRYIEMHRLAMADLTAHRDKIIRQVSASRIESFLRMLIHRNSYSKKRLAAIRIQVAYRRFITVEHLRKRNCQMPERSKEKETSLSQFLREHRMKFDFDFHLPDIFEDLSSLELFEKQFENVDDFEMFLTEIYRSNSARSTFARIKSRRKAEDNKKLPPSAPIAVGTLIPEKTGSSEQNQSDNHGESYPTLAKHRGSIGKTRRISVLKGSSWR